MKASRAYLIFGAYSALTICAIFFATVTREIARWVVQIDYYLNEILYPVFSASSLGISLRQIVSLALTPIVIVAIPVLFYRLIKKQMPPYLIPTIWIVWIIAALSRLLS